VISNEFLENKIKMGNSNPSSFVEIPDTEFTPCAVLLKKMGYKMVVFGFEDILTGQLSACQGHLCIPFYTEEERMKQVQKVSNLISETVSTFMVSLLTQGIGVSVSHHYSSQNNGNVAMEAKKKEGGYIFQGQPLIEKALEHYFGEEVSKFIHIEEAETMYKSLKGISRKYHLGPSEMLVIHHDPNVIRKVRLHHMGGILVDDHTIGFRL